MRRTRNIIRKEITESVNKIKNNYYLSELLELSEIFRKISDDKEYKSVSDTEYEKASVINTIMKMDNSKHIGNVRAVAEALL